MKIKQRSDKNNAGITLIAMIVTIIVLLILAGTTIAMLTGENGILNKATKTKILTELASYKEQLELYKTAKTTENLEFEPESLTAGKVNLSYNTKPEEETGDIKTIIPDITDEYFEILEVIKGELIVNTANKGIIEVAQSLGIQINPYDIEDGVLLSSENNLLLMDETGTLTLPDSVTSIGEGAFANLYGLKKIIIPGTVKRIEKNAFANNSTLEEVIMLDGVEYIGVRSFAACINLRRVEMPNSITEIREEAFSACYNLPEIKLSSNLKYIRAYTFSSCTSLKEIDIVEGIENISNSAFLGSSNLKTVKISKTVKSIDPTAFSNCKNLTNIEIEEGNTNFSFKNGILLGNNNTEMVIILENAITDGNKFIVPDTVTTLADNQLQQFTNITSLEIPASVTNIKPLFIGSNITQITISSANSIYETIESTIYTKDGKQLIRYYGNQNNIKVQDGVEILNEYSFKDKELTKIELPESLKIIQQQVFYGCKNLKSLALGKNVEELHGLFLYGSAIENITINGESSNYSIKNGALYNKDGTKFISPVKPLGTIETYEIPEGVEEISNYAFHNQNNLKEVKLPSTLKTIGSSFNYCSSLTKIEIPSNVTNININCFASCRNLKEIIIYKKQGTIEGSPWGCQYGDRVVKWNG